MWRSNLMNGGENGSFGVSTSASRAAHDENFGAGLSAAKAGPTPARRALGNITNRNAATPGPLKPSGPSSALKSLSKHDSGIEASVSASIDRWAAQGVEHPAGPTAAQQWGAQDAARIKAAIMRGESTRHHLRRAPVAPLSLRPDSPTADSDGESAPVSRKACEDACYEVQRVRFDPLDDLEGGLDPGYLGPDVE